MASKILVLCFIYFQVVMSQYYVVPSYPAYSYGYYSPPASPPVVAPTLATTAKPPPKTPKRSISLPCPKCSPPTATAHFLPIPTEKLKATVISNEKQKPVPPKYNCPLCNGFADVLPNSKIPPPPPIGAPVLPGIFDEIPTIVIPKDLTVKDPSLLKELPPLGDMYEKRKLLKNMRFDQDLLEGFLTGLGIASK